jgi:hypothetical protein
MKTINIAGQTAEETMAALWAAASPPESGKVKIVSKPKPKKAPKKGKRK